MDVFLIIRYKKITMFLDTNESQPVLEVKRMLAGLLKIAPSDQQLYRDGELLDDSRLLTDCGISASTARAHQPCILLLATRGVNGEFDPCDVVAYSIPPELPDVMRAQDSSAHPPEPQLQA